MLNLKTLDDNYKSLINQSIQASIRARKKAGLDLKSPTNIDRLCEAYGITVRFNDINMEGMYEKSSKPRIHVSALRPLARRVFTCVHELGHHIFNHGSSIDELQDNLYKYKDRPPEEILADSFAAFTLMPTLGIRHAFNIRKLNPETASASEIYAIACNFGVGQATLVNHIHYSLQMISKQRRDELGKITPKKIRTELLGTETSEPLIYVDQHFNASTLDVEVGTMLLLPHKVIVDINMLSPKGSVQNGRIFQVFKTGITRVMIPGSEWATYIRVAKQNYVGLARYRHLEDEDEDE